MTILQPDLGEAAQYIGMLAGDRAVTFQTFSDKAELKVRRTDPATGKTKMWDPNAKVLHGSLEQHAEQLIRCNQLGVGVFAMVNAGDGVAHSGKTCRGKANVIAVTSLFLDLDGAPIRPVLDGAALPSMIVRTSPGKYHVYWFVSDCPIGDFTLRQTALINRFGGDPAAKDICRVLRLPGFFHQKAGPEMVTLIDESAWGELR
jgi:hypothetical protein